MRSIAFYLPAFFLSLIFIVGCNSKLETYQTETLADYLALQPGKYITYRLDSTVYTQNGRNEELHSYQEKNVVDAQIADNLGRTSYRIFRFLRNLAGTSPWMASGTYFITPQKNTVEIVENNMRIIQLAAPLKENYSWKGNQYLATEPYEANYSFENDRYIKDWIFNIDKTGQTVSVNGQAIPGVMIITRVNEHDVPDTVSVSNNAVSIKANDTSVWIRGDATAAISMNVAVPTIQNFKMAVFNNSNYPAVLNGVSTPPLMSRVYEFVNGAWTFGSRDAQGNRIDKTTPDLPTASRSFAMDKFAKSIGLVEQELVLWEFQPNQNGSSTSYKIGFGVKRTMIDHN